MHATNICLTDQVKKDMRTCVDELNVSEPLMEVCHKAAIDDHSIWLW